MTQPSTPSSADLPPERRGRGSVAALIAFPVGAGVWLLLWSAGFVTAILALGIAFGALYLYRWGSGGRIGRVGATVVTLITAAAIGVVFAIGLAMHAGDPIPPDSSEVILAVVLSVVFGAIGSIFAWRTAIVQEEQATPRRPLPGFENGPGQDRW